MKWITQQGAVLGALRMCDRDEWGRRVCAAFAVDGTTTLAEAAARLGVSLRQVARWVAEIEGDGPRMPRRAEGGSTGRPGGKDAGALNSRGEP